MPVLRAKFHDGTQRHGAFVRGFKWKGFFQREREAGILCHQGLEKCFVDGHDRDLAGDLESSVDGFDVFAGADLSRFVGKLLVVQKALLSVGHVILKGALTIIGVESREPVGVKEIDVIKIAAISQAVLRENNMTLAFARFVQHRRYPSAGIGASHINHPGSKRADHGFAVVQELLRGPMMDGIRRAVGFEDGGPKRFHVRATPRGIGLIAAALERVKACLDFVPITGFDSIEESLHFVGHLNFGTASEPVDNLTARTGELSEFASDDSLR